MSLIEWDGSLALGHAIIDEQHQTLITILNNLQLALDSNLEQNELRRIFRELRRYSNFHFNEEEALMTEGKFNVWYEHRHEHQKFLDALDALAVKLESGESEIGQDILKFLVDWHIDNIAAADKKLISCL